MALHTMPTNPGNTLETAGVLTLTSTPQTISDGLSPTNLNDYLRFSLSYRSSLNLSLIGLSADANVALLDSVGNLLNLNGIPQSSTNTGTSSESINAILNAGTYYIHIFPGTSTASANYSLNVAASSNLSNDILWRNDATGQNVAWLMNGTAISATDSLVSVGDLNFAIQGTGDFNKDGQTDIIWRNHSTAETVIWLMDGIALQGVVTVELPVAPSWRIAGTGDFNLDGDTDILWHNDITGETSFWLMNGTTFGSATSLSIPVDPSWQIQGVGDFNKDGNPDLFWRNYSTGQNVVWFMNGIALSSFASPLAVGDLNWHTAGIGDFDQDGYADILWRNFGTGENVIWLMNGVVINSVATLPLVDLNWRSLSPFTRADAPIPISVSDAAIAEGNNGTTNLVFTVSLFAASSKPITVDYATADCTAVAGIDYAAVSGRLTFAAGETSQTIAVPITGDTVVENNELVFLNLSNAVNAYLADSQGVGKIQNDDIAIPLTDSLRRVSVAADGTQANNSSANPAISADGRYVAFTSIASNLVAGDTNNTGDVFVYDRQTGQVERISVAADGTQGNGYSGDALSISADGRYVAFASSASNLVAGDTNGAFDMFVRDRVTGQTTRVSVASDGTQANGSSDSVSISGDGRYITFISPASNLVPGDTNSRYDIFVHDQVTGETHRVSVASDGTEANGSSSQPMISADGRYITFVSGASNLVPGDTDGLWNIFLHNRETGETTRVNVSSGFEGDSYVLAPSLSADGRYIAFGSYANLVAEDTNGVLDNFIYDRVTGQTTRISVASDGTEANGHSGRQMISADGRYVAFESHASNLVAGDMNGVVIDVFLHDRVTGETTRISVADDGTQANGDSGGLGSNPAISADGRSIAFSSYASNLVAGDTNGVNDIFLYDRGA